jgi:hypothetical protein
MGVVHNAVVSRLALTLRTLREDSPQAAQRALQETLLTRLTQGYNSQAHPIAAPPNADKNTVQALTEQALLDCKGTNNIPIRIDDKYNTLPATIKAILLSYDAAQEPFSPENQSFMVCLDPDTQETLNMPQRCYGKMLDEGILDKYVNGRTVGSFAAACTAALMLCELKLGLVAGLGAGVAESVAVCGLPAATALHEKGRIAESLKNGGGSLLLEGMPFGGGWSGLLGSGILLTGTGAGLGILNCKLLQRKATQLEAARVAEAYLQLSGEAGKKAKAKGFLESLLTAKKGDLEKLVDQGYRSIAQDTGAYYLLAVDNPKTEARFLQYITQISGTEKAGAILEQVSLVCSPGLGDVKTCAEVVGKAGEEGFEGMLERESAKILGKIKQDVMRAYEEAITRAAIERSASRQEELAEKLNELERLENEKKALLSRVESLERRVAESSMNPVIKARILSGRVGPESAVVKLVPEDARGAVIEYLRARQQLSRTEKAIGEVLEEIKNRLLPETGAKIDEIMSNFERGMGVEEPKTPEELVRSIENGLENALKSADEEAREIIQDAGMRKDAAGELLDRVTGGLWSKTVGKIMEGKETVKNILQKVNNKIKETYVSKSRLREILESAACAGAAYTVGTVVAATQTPVTHEIPKLTITISENEIQVGETIIGG